MLYYPSDLQIMVGEYDGLCHVTVEEEARQREEMTRSSGFVCRERRDSVDWKQTEDCQETQ